MLNSKKIKQDFPILSRQINGFPLTYLDNAATTQKPNAVIDALANYYRTSNANTHRGIYTISQESTEAYEQTREITRAFINAKHTEEIIFTRNATEAINLVAYTWGQQHIQKGDTVLLSALEHHSNLVPWQMLCKKKEAELRVIPLKDFHLDLSKLDELLDEKVKIVAVTQASNVTGSIVDIEKIIKRAHAVGAKVLIDAAQSAPHMPIDVQNLDADFLAFSSHKMLGPTGVGVLYGKKELLEEMPPFMFGGDMILEVEQFSARWNALPWKFEAGTPNIADIIIFQYAIKYLQNLGMENVLTHDQHLLTYAKSKLQNDPDIEMFSPADNNSTGLLSFNVKGVHPHDTAEIFNQFGIAIRSGHHCCQPLMNRLGADATARMSFYVYNDESDIDRAIEAIQQVKKVFKK